MMAPGLIALIGTQFTFLTWSSFDGKDWQRLVVCGGLGGHLFGFLSSLSLRCLVKIDNNRDKSGSLLYFNFKINIKKKDR